MALHDLALRPWFRSLTFASVLVGGALLAPEALASQVKFSPQPFDTDEEGNLTAAGKGAAVTELTSTPGEEEWPLHIWAQIDKGAPGPLYVEFFDTLPGSGKRYLAWRYEHSRYEGEKYVTIEVELDGNTGFNKDHTYTVELSQVNDKGKNLKLASSKLTLKYAEAEEEQEDEGGGDGDEELSEQDVLDSFAGGNGDGNGSDEAPPPVAPPSKKKGCSIEPGFGAAPGVLVLMVLGAGLGRRRR